MSGGGGGGGTYTASDGVTLSGSDFSIDDTTTQRRISQSCVPGFFLQSIAQDGTVVCARSVEELRLQSDDGSDAYRSGVVPYNGELLMFIAAVGQPTPAIIVTPSSQVGIGRVPDDGYMLQSSGTIAAPSFTTASDARAKRNITAIDAAAALDAVMQLQAVRFLYKPSVVAAAEADRVHIGFVAQNVEQHVPEAVQTGLSGMKVRLSVCFFCVSLCLSVSFCVSVSLCRCVAVSLCLCMSALMLGVAGTCPGARAKRKRRRTNQARKGEKHGQPLLRKGGTKQRAKSQHLLRRQKNRAAQVRFSLMLCVCRDRCGNDARAAAATAAAARVVTGKGKGKGKGAGKGKKGKKGGKGKKGKGGDSGDGPGVVDATAKFGAYPPVKKFLYKDAPRLPEGVHEERERVVTAIVELIVGVPGRYGCACLMLVSQYAGS